MTNTFLRLEAISVQEQEKIPDPERGAILEVTAHMNYVRDFSRAFRFQSCTVLQDLIGSLQYLGAL